MSWFVNQAAKLALRCYPFAHGQGRLIDRTFLSRLRFRQQTMQVRCIGGFGMCIFPNDLIGRHLYLTGQFDKTIVDVLRGYCRPGSRVLDIGANVGYVSCALLHAVADLRVVAVEPQPAVFELLAQNVSAVGGARGTALNLAVSDIAGPAKMAVCRGNLGASRLLRAADHDALGAGWETIDVRLATGPQLLELAKLDGVDVIKIDVEGHEAGVLRSLEPVIARFRPRALVFEHEGDLADRANPIRQLFDALKYDLLGVVKKLVGWSTVRVDDLAQGRWRAHDYVAVGQES